MEQKMTGLTMRRVNVRNGSKNREARGDKMFSVPAQ